MVNQTYANELKILTVNCQGLGDTNKRRDVLKYLKNKNYNVYFIQDTHFIDIDENMIKTQWGYKAFFSSFRPNSRGVAIFFNNNCEIEIHNQYKDDSGNYIILDATVEGISFLLINIYGPNSDTPDFYMNIQNKIEEMYSSQHIVIGGDFNLILNKELDSMNYKHLNNPKSRQSVLNLMDTFCLKDVFRENNPMLKRYTWRKKNPIKQSRLDFFLISESMLTMNPCIKYENSYRSDHSPVILCYKTNEFKKGRGFWKFNNTLLTDKEYVKLIKEKIEEVKIQYSCLVYNVESIPSIDNDLIQFTVSDQTFLDILLMEIRGKSISYSTFKKKKICEKELQLEREISNLEQNMTQQSVEELTIKQKEIEDIRMKKLKGQCIRSKVKWIEEGEKPSRYFVSLESRNYISKLIPKIEKEDGTICTDQFDILNESKLFYENLYKKRETIEKENIHKRLKDYDIPKLTKKESDSLEGPVTKLEVLNFLKQMKNDKSPGPDGFSSEFF